MRETSIRVYHQIKAEGLLSKLRFLIYESLHYHGPMTQNETARQIRSEGHPHIDHSISPRFKEMERLKVICVSGERPCRITGRTVTEYDVTDSLPTSYEKKPTALELATDRILELEDYVKKLENYVSKLESQLGRKPAQQTLNFEQ